jgi:hypothetical protein
MQDWSTESKNGFESGQLLRNLLGAGATPMKLFALSGFGLFRFWAPGRHYPFTSSYLKG